MVSNELLTFQDFYGRYKSAGKTQLARLLKLSGTLEKWSHDRFAENTEVIKVFSIRDVQALRQLIESEVSSITPDESNVVTDQILFLLIGAIKVQAETNSTATWPLVNQTIRELVSPTKKNNILMYFSMISFVITVGFALTILSINNKYTQVATLNPTEVAQVVPINQVGSKAVDNLINVYNKMKRGNCQLPQALLLQPKDRDAFIAFVTEGEVTISTADSLKKSLDYADCSYPQKLMEDPLNIFQGNG